MTIHKHRSAFETQCLRAEMASAWHHGEVDVVMARWPERTIISVVGDTISRAAYEIWPQRGARLRVLRSYKDGKQQELHK